MQDNEMKKPSIVKRHKRKILTVVVVVIVVPAVAYFFSQVTRENGSPFTTVQLEQANSVLLTATPINDSENDFVAMSGSEHGKENNPNPYPVPFGDYKQLTIAADSQYLYIKTEVYGAFPITFSEAPSFSGDRIQSLYTKVSIVNDHNETQALSIGGIDYRSGLYPTFVRYFFVHPSGVKEGEETFRDQFFDGLITGGFGYDYILQAVPLEKLGLKDGDTIMIQAFIEASSDKYHHAFVDVLSDESNQGQKKLSTYTITI